LLPRAGVEHFGAERFQHRSYVSRAYHVALLPPDTADVARNRSGYDEAVTDTSFAFLFDSHPQGTARHGRHLDDYRLRSHGEERPRENNRDEQNDPEPAFPHFL
jgi:hypothetical protein